MKNLHFARPLFDADSLDYKHLSNLTAGYTIGTPGGSLAGALQYYRIEAYARKDDRDEACGMTAHPDIAYAPTTIVSAEEFEKLGLRFRAFAVAEELCGDTFCCRVAQRFLVNAFAQEQTLLLLVPIRIVWSRLRPGSKIVTQRIVDGD